MCNEALKLNQNVRTGDAVEYLTTTIEHMDRSGFHPVEHRLSQHYMDHLEYLRQISCLPQSVNPKLEKLARFIVKVFKQTADSRAIVFAQSRGIVQALLCWMKETPELEWLNPRKLVGQARKEDGGMTQNEQQDVLERFKDGHCRILIATSVAEEGLDIKKCNLVIRYDYVTNEIAMVQTRGRARAIDSRYIALVTEGSGLAEREQRNVIKEQVMDIAVWQLQEDIDENPEQFEETIKSVQNNCYRERCDKCILAQNRQFVPGNFRLLCRKCQAFACCSFDLRKFESVHHAVIAEDFLNHCKIAPHPKPKNNGLPKLGKVRCKVCACDWGIITLYRSKSMFVIKIVSFLMLDSRGVKSHAKKWSDVPFEVGDFELTPAIKTAVSRISEEIAIKLWE